MSYRAYDLERKPLMVGWQITIFKDGKSVQNGNATKGLVSAVDEAEKFVDRGLAEIDTITSDAKT